MRVSALLLLCGVQAGDSGYGGVVPEAEHGGEVACGVLVEAVGVSSLREGCIIGRKGGVYDHREPGHNRFGVCS
jgi:hypothetical protein